MARMVVIYRTLAKQIPNLRKYEVSDGPIAMPVGTPNVHPIGTLHFDDLAAVENAFAGAEGQAAGAAK